jgi:5'-nucleotidase / UDP-sugar diphosphatase
LGLEPTAGAYPTKISNKDGDLVCVGQAWEYAKAIGEMTVSFDDQGRVSSCSGQSALLLAKSFKQQNSSNEWVTTDAAQTTAILAALAGNPVAKTLDGDATTAALLQSYSDEVDAKKAVTIASLTEDLCLVRVPGESTNRSDGVSSCSTANTLAKGSDVAQVVADAFLAGSLAADIAIQNAGGVRVPLAAGDLTLNDAFTLLPFTNVLVELQMTGAQIKAVLEDAVANHLDNGGSTGSHPYAAGLRWDLDMSASAGNRFTNIEARDRDSGTWVALGLTQTYTVATNDYIASGRDGYTTFGEIFALGNYVNNYLLYTQTFVDYVSTLGTLGKPARANYSHKSVVTSSGVSLGD